MNIVNRVDYDMYTLDSTNELLLSVRGLTINVYSKFIVFHLNGEKFSYPFKSNINFDNQYVWEIKLNFCEEVYTPLNLIGVNTSSLTVNGYVPDHTQLSIIDFSITNFIGNKLYITHVDFRHGNICTVFEGGIYRKLSIDNCNINIFKDCHVINELLLDNSKITYDVRNKIHSNYNIQNTTIEITTNPLIVQYVPNATLSGYHGSKDMMPILDIFKNKNIADYITMVIL